MSTTEIKEKEEAVEEIVQTEAAAAAAEPSVIPAIPAVPAAPQESGEPRRAQRGGRGGRPERRTRPSSNRSRQPRSEFDQRIINIRRVARVVAGGRRFSFSVAIIVGNKKGKVGVGVGKASDTSQAIDKAVRDAKKRIITVPLTKNSSIAHDVEAKYCASHVSIMPVKGRGLVAGSSVRGVLELCGITDVIAKLHSGSKNGLNNARSAIEALSMLKS